MTNHACRACRSQSGHLVLDLGEQPACDYFPRASDPGPDPQYPLQMWLCARCGLAQLVADPTVPEEPRGAEPAALVAQAAEAVGRAGSAGLLHAGATVTEYGSPHGGSWLNLLAERGLVPQAPGQRADVIVDCFGMMHAANQAAALAERSAGLTDHGVLLMQFHALAAIIRSGQWNALRHAHYAYYSATALVGLLAAHGLRADKAWRFDLYGGTVLLAASKGDPADSPAGLSVAELLDDDASAGVTDPAALGGLSRDAQAGAAGLRAWLEAQREEGRQLLGYGAASRAVALLHKAGADRGLLPAVADASPAKQGLRMPGTDIPVVSPAELREAKPGAVLLFLADLLAEVRSAYPEVEAHGGRWVNADSLAGWPGRDQVA
jgi:C-methyltransferase C-terminal domain/Putative zinc binding domain